MTPAALAQLQGERCRLPDAEPPGTPGTPSAAAEGAEREAAADGDQTEDR